MIISKWIEIDPSEHRGVGNSTSRERGFESFASPYDIPDAVRAIVDKEKKTFDLEFRYISDEDEVVAQPEIDRVTLFIGKRSQRLRKIGIQLDGDPETMAKHIVGAIQDLLKRARPVRQQNYRTVCNVVNTNSQLLLSTGFTFAG